MNFFCTREHGRRWIEEEGEGETDLFLLDLEKAMTVARWLFSVQKPRTLRRR